MATVTIWNNAAPPSGATSTGTGAARTDGIQFTVSSSCQLTGYWFYVPAGETSLTGTSYTANLWTTTNGSTGTLVSAAAAAGSGTFTAGQWNFISLGTSVTLSPGTTYVAGISHPNLLEFLHNYWNAGGPGASGVTSAPITVPGSATALNAAQQPTVAAANTFPPSASSASWYGIDIQVSTSSVTVLTTAIANVVQSVSVRRWLTASGGTAPYTWAVTVGSLPAGLSLASDGTLSGTPTGTGTSSFTVQATDSASNVATASLSITSVSAPFSPGSPTTDGNGVTTYSITSVINMNDAETIRVLPPTSPNTAYPHAFLLTLPVNTGTDDQTFGDGLDTVRVAGLHNSLNLTVVEISTGGGWLADNPSNSSLLQETYLLQVVAWTRANFGTGSERVYLVGFSRSGIAAQSLFLRRPDIYAGVASWDAPFSMDGYNGTDPHGTVGGGSSSSYGTQDNFSANYQLSAANLAKWKAGTNLGTLKRIWVGGANFFNADVPDYDAALTSASILHTYSFVSASSHNWSPTPGWVTPAVTDMVNQSQHTSSGTLTITPVFTATRTRGRNRGASLSPTPSLTVARTRGVTRGASLSITPSLTAGRTRGKVRSASLSPAPVLSAGRVRGHTRAAALSIVPVLHAIGFVGSGNRLILSAVSEVNVNAGLTLAATIVMNVGAPYQGNIRGLATDRWSPMYPS